jgi:dinuclear metal center YbgI/SA1388 family protein
MNGEIRGRDISQVLEQWAPLFLQENYDNSGWLVGNPDQILTGVLCSLDCTEAVVKEAIEKNCNLIVAHHPIWFGGKKKLGNHYTDRVIQLALKNGIGLYACHTNADSVLTGVNAKISEKLGLLHSKILSPKTESLLKLETYVPNTHAEKIRQHLFEAGAGWVGNYSHASFNVSGMGTYWGQAGSNPSIGSAGRLEKVEETKIEVLLPIWKKNEVLQTLFDVHPYEEVAYYLQNIDNVHQGVGMGMVGNLPTSVSWESWISQLKQTFEVPMIKHTSPVSLVQKIAVCGGSGSFLLPDAIRSGADVFVTADFKYHEFFEADGKITIVDIGHYESEQFTSEIFCDLIRKKFPIFAVLKSTVRTNPVNYC